MVGAVRSQACLRSIIAADETYQTYSLAKSSARITGSSFVLCTHMSMTRSPSGSKSEQYFSQVSSNQLINRVERQGTLMARVRPRKQICVHNTWRKTKHTMALMDGQMMIKGIVTDPKPGVPEFLQGCRKTCRGWSVLYRRYAA